MLEHPEIGWIERTGYPSWMQEGRYPDEDGPYEFDPPEFTEPEVCYED